MSSGIGLPIHTGKNCYCRFSEQLTLFNLIYKGIIQSYTYFLWLNLGVYGGGDGLMGLSRTVLPAIESVAVEHENIVQVNSNSIRSKNLKNAVI